MKTILKIVTLVTALVGAAASASADVFNLQGYVNFNATTGPVLHSTFGITTGDPFTGTLTYDSSQPGYNPFGLSDPLNFNALPGPLVSIMVRGQQFSLVSWSLFLSHPNGANSWQITTLPANFPIFTDYTVYNPWGTYTGYEGDSLDFGEFTLGNSPGFSLPDNSLPSQLDIADWSSVHHILFGTIYNCTCDAGNLGTGGSFYLDAEITSITVAPEPGTMAILGLGAVGCVLFRRKRRSKSR